MRIEGKLPYLQLLFDVTRVRVTQRFLQGKITSASFYFLSLKKNQFSGKVANLVCLSIISDSFCAAVEEWKYCA